MKEKEGLDSKFDYSSLNDNKKESKSNKAKLKRAKAFIEKSEKCRYHELKSLNDKIYQKVYWCKKTNNRCNIGSCPLNKIVND